MPRFRKYATEEERHAAKLASQHRYVATHYEKVRASVRRAMRNRYADDPEAARARARQYDADNRDKIRAQRRENYRKNRERELARARAYRENNREKIQSRQKAANRKKYLKHREKILAAMREARQADPQQYNKSRREARAQNVERARQQERQRYQRNPQIKQRALAKRRARKKSLPDTFSQEEHTFMLQYWGFACAVCGNEEGFEWTLALDHWIALAATDCPGTVATNMLPLCDGVGGCNTSKQHKPAHIWLVERFGKRKAKKIAHAIETYFAIVRERFGRVAPSSEAAD